jgi:hypothetical protein
MALAGVVWALFPGFCIGKFIPSLPIWLFAILWVLVLLGSLVWALRRKSVVTRTAAPGWQMPSGLGSALMLLAFLAALVASGGLCARWGQWELKTVKARIAAAGYDIHLPANNPKIPDRDNGAFYLSQANQVPSAKALVYTWDSKSTDRNKPFWGKKTQQDTLDQLAKDLLAGPLGPAEEGLALRLLAAHQESLRLLMAASQAKGFDWGMDFTVKPAFMIETPRMSGLLNWVRLLTLKAYLQAKQGRGRDAMKTLRVCFFLGDAACQTRSIIGEMIGVACYKTTLARGPEILPSITAQALEKDFLPALKTPMLMDGFKQAEEFEQFVRWDWRENLFWLEYLPFQAHDLALYDAYKLEKLETLSLPYSRQKDAEDKLDADYQRHHWFLGDYANTQDFGLHSKLLEAVAYSRLAAVSIGARLYHQKTGHWPAQISQLTLPHAEDALDPFSDGGPLSISPKGDGVQLTSLGPDEWDSSGKHLGRRPLVWGVDKE